MVAHIDLAPGHNVGCAMAVQSLAAPSPLPPCGNGAHMQDVDDGRSLSAERRLSDCTLLRPVRWIPLVTYACWTLRRRPVARSPAMCDARAHTTIKAEEMLQQHVEHWAENMGMMGGDWRHLAHDAQLWAQFAHSLPAATTHSLSATFARVRCHTDG